MSGFESSVLQHLTTSDSLAPNAASNCWKMLATYLRYFAKKKTTFEGQIDWPC